ncbi:hypothetical protein GUJ93_ZPchr0006g44015 [Zizania palustris]|uniref:Uncharacterized protein n=1 Tax=Zizania palustris TaxID=103762 RepID=A0A8J5VLN0_ZIZPA|nr:hypothetical protein GUJ93_ZPchr0006g44015 [Zizania palustris]
MGSWPLDTGKDARMGSGPPTEALRGGQWRAWGLGATSRGARSVSGPPVEGHGTTGGGTRRGFRPPAKALERVQRRGAGARGHQRRGSKGVLVLLWVNPGTLLGPCVVNLV